MDSVTGIDCTAILPQRLRSPGYYPWGETRFGCVATEYLYSGQYQH